MTKDEALKLALEALELANVNHWWGSSSIENAITAIKEALAQPEYDYKDLYEKEKRKSAMWLAKYEEVAGPTPKAIPMAQPEQEPVAHSVVAGALFDFMGWLTSRNKRLTLSGADEASPAVEAIQEFSEKRGLSLKDAEVGFWTEFLFTPPQRKPLTDEEIKAVCAETWSYDPYVIARAIEEAHGIKGLV